ncbi:acyltransferase [Spongiibacter sp. KMU-158]|uniref:Acyltransferase n=1 Tax=Spongiibacter pelagi TaxID=2760804 RepID=A0A927GUV7_9GAMM|nr:acyltransferase [Spongiibacter pelagi]MBD2857735.1 acyltransferase [Spongiibacter pelagi]
MSFPISHYSSGRDNNFNLLRFIAATLVLVSHSFPLAGGEGTAEPLASLVGMTLGGLSVDIFFVSSGFLVAGSFLSQQSVKSFAWARVLRIYPALFIAMLFCVFAVGLVFTDLSAGEYLANKQIYKFLIENSLLVGGIEYDLPGVFLNNPYPVAVNGSLWTLPVEVKMYIFLALIFSAVFFLERRFSLGILKVALPIIVAISFAIDVLAHFEFADIDGNRLFTLFFFGSALYVWRDRVVLSFPIFIVAVLAVVLSGNSQSLFMVFYTLLLPYIVLFLAYVPGGIVRRFNELGDYSYGVYIYAFPVQQSVAAAFPSISILGMTLISFVFTLILAVLSWRFIEKRALKLKTKRAAPELRASRAVQA